LHHSLSICMLMDSLSGENHKDYELASFMKFHIST
jgi:hypothetical protein